MPLKKTIRRARRDKRQGKSANTQAGEFVHEQIKRIRKGEHGARSAKQAIAIGLSEARRAGVKLPLPKAGKYSKALREKAKSDDERGEHPKPVSRKRSRATVNALKKESTAAGSHTALSRQAHKASRRRSAKDRSAAAKKAARTRARNKVNK